MATIQAYDGELDRVSEEYKGQVQSCEAEVALLNEKIKEQEEKQ